MKIKLKFLIVNKNDVIRMAPMDEPKIKKLILRGGTEVDVSTYDHFWCQDGSFGGGSSPLTQSSFSDYVMGNRQNNPSRYVVLSKSRDMYGKPDPQGLHIEASDIVAFS